MDISACNSRLSQLFNNWMVMTYYHFWIEVQTIINFSNMYLKDKQTLLVRVICLSTFTYFWGQHSLFLYAYFCMICDAMVNIYVVDVLRDMRLLRSNWRHTE